MATDTNTGLYDNGDDYPLTSYEIDISTKELLDNLKKEVKNYRDVLTGFHGMPEDSVTRFFVLGKQVLKDFLDKNPTSDVIAVRIYMAKATNDGYKNDYKFVLMPCTEGSYVDKTSGKARGATACKYPPGCNFTGAVLLEP